MLGLALSAVAPLDSNKHPTYLLASLCLGQLFLQLPPVDSNIYSLDCGCIKVDQVACFLSEIFQRFQNYKMHDSLRHASGNVRADTGIHAIHHVLKQYMVFNDI